MAVDLMTGSFKPNNTSNTNTNNHHYAAMIEENAVREATAAGLQSVEKLIKLLSSSSHQDHHHRTTTTTTTPLHLSSPDPTTQHDSQYKAVADVAVNKFKKVISLLDRTRTGHARFRSAPVRHHIPPALPPPPPPPSHKPKQTPEQQQQLMFESKPVPGSAFTRVFSSPSTTSVSSHIQRLPPLPHGNQPAPPYSKPSAIGGGGLERRDSCTTINFSTSSPPVSSAVNSYISSLTGETTEHSVQPSISSGGFHINNMSQVSSAGKPPLSSSSLKRKCNSMDDSKCGGSSIRCHCSKRRKSRMRRVVRVPAISLKMADIPPDDYSWRKYGQKPIKGSPHPRGYYKCSSVRGCPARKHVERAIDDASVLVVTYEGDHNHSLSVTDATVAAALVLESS